MPVSISHWFYIMVVALGITSHLVYIVILTLRSFYTDRYITGKYLS